MLKIVMIINDIIERNKLKAYLNRAKRKIDEIEFELTAEFDNNREAVNYLYLNNDIDIIIAENQVDKIFSGQDLLMLAEKEFKNLTIILLNESETELELNGSCVSNLEAVITKRASYLDFINVFLMALLKQKNKKDEIKQKEDKLNDYRTIIDHLHDAIFLIKVDCDENFYYKRINGTHQRLTAMSNEEICGKRLDEIFNKETAAKLQQNYKRCLKKKSKISYTEKLNFPAGEKIWQTSLYPVIKNNRVEEIVGASYDITDMEEKQKKLEYLKRHDKSTGLYNKEYFDQIFNKITQEADYQLALILINVENFNLINQFFSYQSGNQILKEIGNILAQITDSNKIAAHLCADHFVVILKNQTKKEVAKTLKYIKKELAKINIDEIYFDITAVSLFKNSEIKKARDFFNYGVSKTKLNKIKKSSESNFYNSLFKSLRKNNYKDLRQSRELISICKKYGEKFSLNKDEKEKLLLLAKHHDIGKLAVADKIIKKGDRLAKNEWKQYQKHVIISTNFALGYYDLLKIADLIYYHHENYAGTGWPDGLKGKEIPYLSRVFAVINFYSNLKSNLYFPFLEDNYYFGALEDNEIIKELNFYKGTVFDPDIVDNFIEYLKTDIKVDN